MGFPISTDVQLKNRKGGRKQICPIKFQPCIPLWHDHKSTYWVKYRSSLRCHIVIFQPFSSPLNSLEEQTTGHSVEINIPFDWIHKQILFTWLTFPSSKKTQEGKFLLCLLKRISFSFRSLSRASCQLWILCLSLFGNRTEQWNTKMNSCCNLSRLYNIKDHK